AAGDVRARARQSPLGRLLQRRLLVPGRAARPLPALSAAGGAGALTAGGARAARCLPLGRPQLAPLLAEAVAEDGDDRAAVLGRAAAAGAEHLDGALQDADRLVEASLPLVEAHQPPVGEIGLEALARVLLVQGDRPVRVAGALELHPAQVARGLLLQPRPRVRRLVRHGR